MKAGDSVLFQTLKASGIWIEKVIKKISFDSSHKQAMVWFQNELYQYITINKITDSISISTPFEYSVRWIPLLGTFDETCDILRKLCSTPVQMFINKEEML